MAARKTRRGAAKKAAPGGDAAPSPRKLVPVENILPGTVLHLGDGRRLRFGESARLRETIARQLAARGQVTCG